VPYVCPPLISAAALKTCGISCGVFGWVAGHGVDSSLNGFILFSVYDKMIHKSMELCYDYFNYASGR